MLNFTQGRRPTNPLRTNFSDALTAIKNTQDGNNALIGTIEEGIDTNTTRRFRNAVGEASAQAGRQLTGQELINLRTQFGDLTEKGGVNYQNNLTQAQTAVTNKLAEDKFAHTKTTDQNDYNLAVEQNRKERERWARIDDKTAKQDEKDKLVTDADAGFKAHMNSPELADEIVKLGDNKLAIANLRHTWAQQGATLFPRSNLKDKSLISTYNNTQFVADNIKEARAEEERLGTEALLELENSGDYVVPDKFTDGKELPTTAKGKRLVKEQVVEDVKTATDTINQNFVAEGAEDLYLQANDAQLEYETNKVYTKNEAQEAFDRALSVQEGKLLRGSITKDEYDIEEAKLEALRSKRVKDGKPLKIPTKPFFSSPGSKIPSDAGKRFGFMGRTFNTGVDNNITNTAATVGNSQSGSMRRSYDEKKSKYDAEVQDRAARKLKADAAKLRLADLRKQVGKVADSNTEVYGNQVADATEEVLTNVAEDYKHRGTPKQFEEKLRKYGTKVIKNFGPNVPKGTAKKVRAALKAEVAAYRADTKAVEANAVAFTNLKKELQMKSQIKQNEELNIKEQGLALEARYKEADKLSVKDRLSLAKEMIKTGEELDDGRLKDNGYRLLSSAANQY